MTKPVGLILIGSVLLAAGCNRDPGCQRTIGLLRAEKLELEDEYFLLKSKYEQALAQLQAQEVAPAPADPDIIYENDSDLDDLLKEPTIIIDEPTGSAVRKPIAPTARNHPRVRTPTLAGLTDVELARYIQSIDVSQLSNLESNRDLQILVRPIDENGEIIPITGGLKIELTDVSTGSRSRIASWQYSSQDVARWVNDTPGGQPGIHVRLPLKNRRPDGDRLVLDVQYRTTDNRNIVFQKELAASSSGQYRLDPDIDNVDGLLVEIDNETNFESIESTDDAGQASTRSSRQLPRWKPNR